MDIGILATFELKVINTVFISERHIPGEDDGCKPGSHFDEEYE